MDLKKLAKIALDIRKNAYAPYSGFKVGAALLGKSGEIYTGVNVENSSFGAAVCAERAACTAAVSAGEVEFLAIAVASDSEPPSAPCGICRQFLSEFGTNLEIILVNCDGKTVKTGLKELLPFEFNLKGLHHEKRTRCKGAGAGKKNSG